MNNPPYGQPGAPADPAPVAPGVPVAQGAPQYAPPTAPMVPTYALPPASAPASSSRRLVLPIVGAALLAVVAFGAGFAVANATSSNGTTTAQGAQNGQGGQFGQTFGQGFGPGASGRPRGGFGGGTTGTVGSVSADQMTVTTATGGSKIVLLAPTTKVTQVSSATKATADIATGNNVTVIGTTNPDGSVTATTVIIGDLSILGRGPRGGDNGSPAPSTAP